MTDTANHCSAKFKVNPAKLLIAPTSIANKKLIDNSHGHTKCRNNELTFFIDGALITTNIYISVNFLNITN